MSEHTENDTGVASPGPEYRSAQVVQCRTAVESSAPIPNVRSVTTRRNSGVVDLRYAPQEPRTVNDDTTS